MIADPRYTLTDLYFLFCIQLDGKTAIKHLTSGARQWYTLAVSLLFEGIIRGVVEVYKQEEQFYIRLANNRKRILSGDTTFTEEALIERMLWFIRKQKMPYAMSSFITIGCWEILHPAKKIQRHLVQKGILSTVVTKRLWGLITTTSFPVQNIDLHTTLRKKVEALLNRTDTSAPTMQEILFLSLIRRAHILPILYPHIVANGNFDFPTIIEERLTLLRTTLQQRQSSSPAKGIHDNITIGLTASEESMEKLLDDEEQFGMMLASIEIMLDTVSVALEGIDSFGDSGADGGGADGGGDGGGGDGGGGGD